MYGMTLYCKSTGKIGLRLKIETSGTFESALFEGTVSVTALDLPAGAAGERSRGQLLIQ